MLSLKYWMTMHEQIPQDKRHCSLLGVPCYRLSIRIWDFKWEVAKNVWKEANQDSTPSLLRQKSKESIYSVIVDIQEQNTPTSHQKREYRNWCNQEEEEVWDNNTLSVLKALGRQGISIRSYDGTGGITTLRAWMDSVQRHLRLFNIKGGLNQVTLAVCFLDGKARDWWEKTYTTRADREIQDLEQLYKTLQLEFQPLNEDFKLAMQWRSLHQKGDLNQYRQEVY